MESLLLVITLAVLAGVTFLNGFHDASNAVSSAVRTRALTPRLAIIMVSLFTATGTFLATSLGSTLADRFQSSVPYGPAGLVTVLCGLLAAGTWGLFTWWKGQPSSSTHAMLAGLAGAGLAAAAVGLEHPADAAALLLRQVLLPLVVTSLLAPVLAYALVIPIVWCLRHTPPRKINEAGRSAQAIGAAAVALAHGVQDGQRAVAMTVVTVSAAGLAVPDGSVIWLEVCAALLLGGGVLGGGWRITHTLSTRLVTLDPLRAGAANAVSATLLFVGAFALKLPISSTQAVTAALVGAGINQRHSTVNWATARRILGFWLATPLACALLAGTLMLAASPLLR